MPLKVVFRADASIQIGAGHVMRCLTLARALRNCGHQCEFVYRNHQGNLGAMIAHEGFDIHILNSASSSGLYFEEGSALAHAHWLGTAWQHDAEQTLKAISGNQIDWLVVDHYALDARWERRVAAHVNKIMVIDDIADRPHECQLLLDQNLGRTAQDYNGLVPETCTRMIGPHYALLRPEFAEFREASLERRRIPKLGRILITLGGVDKDNVTGQVLDALAKSSLPQETELDIVMGASAPALETVRLQSEALPFRTTVSVNVSDMAERMYMADLCIGAAGSTSWERCCLGLPSIMVVLAENQREIARALEHSGAAYLLNKEELSVHLVPLLDELRISSCPIVDLSNRAKAICDGLGAPRLVEEFGRNLAP